MDREKFIDGVVKVFKNESYKSEIFKRSIVFAEGYNDSIFDGYSLFSAQLNHKTNINSGISFYDERLVFVKSLIQKICAKWKLQVGVEFFGNEYGEDRFARLRGLTDTKNSIIKINRHLLESSNVASHDISYNNFSLKSSRLIGTIIHECRHLYNYKNIYKNRPHKNSLLNYLAYCRNFLIPTPSQQKTSIFKSYQKQCDKTESNNVNCHINKMQNLYQIQPNERDPRYVANEVLLRLNIK